jgi:hypothetical protein
MTNWNGFKGRALALSDGDVRLIAGYLGCQVAALQAVIKIESAGAGFRNWRPIILCEPHIFYRELGKGAKRDKAVSLGLAYAKWGAKPYPKTQDARYGWLERAMAIDESAGLKSCSWGLGQVMGFNHKLCGFDTVQEFVLAMMLSEGAQLYAMARFIVSNSLQGHLRTFKWSSFARGYNGSGYAKHGYHTKLASAYAKRPASEKVTPPAPDIDTLENKLGIRSPIAQPTEPRPGTAPGDGPEWGMGGPPEPPVQRPPETGAIEDTGEPAKPSPPASGNLSGIIGAIVIALAVGAFIYFKFFA